MSSPFPSLEFPKLALEFVQSLLVKLLTHISSSVFLVIFGTSSTGGVDSQIPSHHQLNRPSPLLVPVPVVDDVVVVDSATLKAEQTLLLARYGDKLRKWKFDGDICTVCLSSMKEDDMVTEIRSCCHVFHRECLDTWIDIGKVTCPLCRCHLNPFPHPHNKEYLVTAGGDDPWRRERMIYLFGDDITF